MSTNSNTRHYFINATLFNHQLIILKRYEIDPIPKLLSKNSDVTVKIHDKNGIEIESFDNCHIDATNGRRLRLPLEAITWIKNEFPFSYACYEAESVESIWKKKDVSVFLKNVQNKKPLDSPAETLELTWNDKEKYLCIEAGFQITLNNAEKVLSAKGMSKVLPYLYSSAKNISSYISETNSRKSGIMYTATRWLSASEYKKTSFSRAGLYILRRKENDEYAYYVGKAKDIKMRVTVDREKKAVFHRDEKNESNKQYDDICCISFNMDDIKRLRGGDVDSALYALEDLAIHTTAMILKSEGKKIDNRQLNRITSECLGR